jgi:hypothetical protein
MIGQMSAMELAIEASDKLVIKALVDDGPLSVSDLTLSKVKKASLLKAIKDISFESIKKR